MGSTDATGELCFLNVVKDETVLLDHVGLELVGAGEGPVAVRTPELLLGVEGPDVFPDLGVFREALEGKDKSFRRLGY